MRVASVLERRGVRKVSLGILKGKKLLERHKSGWENNIELDFQEIKWGVCWNHLAQVRDKWRYGNV